MNRIRLPVATIDAIAIIGLAALAIGVGFRVGADIAIALVGALLLLYAIFASRSEAPS